MFSSVTVPPGLSTNVASELPGNPIGMSTPSCGPAPSLPNARSVTWIVVAQPGPRFVIGNVRVRQSPVTQENVAVEDASCTLAFKMGAGVGAATITVVVVGAAGASAPQAERLRTATAISKYFIAAEYTVEVWPVCTVWHTLVEKLPPVSYRSTNETNRYGQKSRFPIRPVTPEAAGSSPVDPANSHRQNRAARDRDTRR